MILKIVKKLLIIMLFSMYGHIINCFPGNSNRTLLSLVTTSKLYESAMKLTNPYTAFLTSFQSVNQGPILAQNFTSSVGVSSLSIRGDVQFDNHGMLTIALPDSINDIIVNGLVTLTMPVGGIITVTVAGAPYTGAIPGLTIKKTNLTNSFEINASVVINGTLASRQSAITIDGSLSVTPFCNQGDTYDYVSINSHTTLTVVGDITFDGASLGWICHNGTIQSIAGNIVMKNSLGSVLGSYAIFSDGAIIVPIDKSLTLQNNVAQTSAQGVFIGELATIQAGTINIINNVGSVDFFGTQIDGNVYTNAFNATVDCSSNNQSLLLSTTIYEYINQTVPLSDSAITITNVADSCFVGGGTLITTGSITFRGNNLEMTGTVNIQGVVTIDLPMLGKLLIDSV